MHHDETPPTSDQPATPPPPPPPGPERPPLLRSADDRVVGGVCAGVARHLGVDPLVVRAATLVLTLFAGAGAVLYLAGLIFLPDGRDATAGATPDATRSRAATVGGVVVIGLAALILIPTGFWILGALVPFAVLGFMGLAAWWAVSGEGTDGGPRKLLRRSALGIGVIVGCAVLAASAFYFSATGADVVVACLVIAAGLALLAGSFVRPVRFLILPALALAFPLAVAEAADVDLRGGAGERVYRPASAGDLRDSYRLGVGQLVVDLRATDLPAGDTRLTLDVGFGEAVLLVSPETCVASRAEIGAGAVQAFGEDTGGLNFDWEDSPRAPAGTPRIVLDAEIGIGALTIDYVADDDRWDDFGDRHDDDDDPVRLSPPAAPGAPGAPGLRGDNIACVGGRAG